MVRGLSATTVIAPGVGVQRQDPGGAGRRQGRVHPAREAAVLRQRDERLIILDGVQFYDHSTPHFPAWKAFPPL